jgi:hypothetical protein
MNLTQEMWRHIRETYETTEISYEQLAREWGMKSKTTIIRVAQREGWRKNVQRIADDMARAAVALDAEIDGEKAKSRHRSRNFSETPPGIDPQKIEPITTKTLDTLTGTTADTRAQDTEDLDVAVAVNLAKLQAEATRRHLAHARMVADIGVALVGHIYTLLSSTDPDAVGDSRMRLLTINPDKETLASLMKVAATMVESGSNMQRRALGMDKGAVVQDAKPAQPMERVLQALSPDTLMGLRRAAQEVARLPPPKSD